MDVKNTKEVYALLINSLNKAAEAKSSDGKISAYEVLKLAVEESSDLMAAAADIALVKAELQDLDAEELKELAVLSFQLKDAIVKFVKA